MSTLVVFSEISFSVPLWGHRKPQAQPADAPVSGTTSSVPFLLWGQSDSNPSSLNNHSVPEFPLL